MATPLAAICPGCFRHKGGAVALCPHCGYDAGAARSPLLLPTLVRLNQRYLIGRTLGKPGGFGVTYLGFDLTLQVKVAVKEYCPRDLVGRDTSRRTLTPHSQEDGELFQIGLKAFLDEARTLAKFDHANVVRVRDFFEANGTAYLVMDYYEGESLLEYLERHGGKLPWRTALELMLPVLDGLREVHHRGFLHRDVKPHNIYLTAQGRPILLDFGSARQAMGERSRSLSVMLTEGYAPFEQYTRRGGQGPWTDIYGAAATLYLLITGQTPLPATERIRNDELIPPLQLVPDLPQPLNAALLQGLATDPKKRPQKMEQFEQWLHGIVVDREQVNVQTSSFVSLPTGLGVINYLELRRKIEEKLVENKRATLYEVLDLLPTCSDSEISAKVKLIIADAKKAGALLSTEIQHAISILQDDNERKNYDRKMWDILNINKKIILTEKSNSVFLKNKFFAILILIYLIFIGYFSKDMFDYKNTNHAHNKTITMEQGNQKSVGNLELSEIVTQRFQMKEPASSHSGFQQEDNLIKKENQYLENLAVEIERKRREQEQRMELQREELKQRMELQRQEQEQFIELQRKEQQQRQKREQERQAEMQMMYWRCVNQMKDRGYDNYKTLTNCAQYK